MAINNYDSGNTDTVSETDTSCPRRMDVGVEGSFIGRLEILIYPEERSHQPKHQTFICIKKVVSVLLKQIVLAGIKLQAGIESNGLINFLI
ncbi:hypothetical protein ALC57_04278 [Trachymyrmex cornetzi]|uniref:Uncharacterized protein n=1 Tax=Trachymyrmex cornetzi TaxID=471704 RepID=A0A195EEW8_9HYME|nr:hypothetical protein ALC57_04278 [Trachymyrmex cornetzi]